jgi:hypothetical protein
MERNGPVSEELLYTSSPRGLDPGVSGYCTVAKTPGIGKALQQALESLSRYEPLFLPGDPHEDDNPVVYRHKVLLVAGQRWHVLSRVAYSGRDYTGRNNQFAHHVLLSPAEIQQFPGGPGWLMHQRDFFQTEWNGRIERLEPRSQLGSGGGNSAWNCRKWEETTSDPGWAGWLVQMTSDGSERPCGLLVDTGVNTLRLVAEALELLPESERWDVSFCTYAFDLQSGCQWNGFIRGTRVANAAQSSLQDRMIDVRPGVPLPDEAAGSTWVRYVKTGEHTAADPPPGRLATVGRSGNRPSGPPPRQLKPPRAPAMAMSAPEDLPPVRPRRSAPPPNLPPTSARSSIGGPLLWMGAGAIGLLFLLGIATVLIPKNRTKPTGDDPPAHAKKESSGVHSEGQGKEETKPANSDGSKQPQITTLDGSKILRPGSGAKNPIELGPSQLSNGKRCEFVLTETVLAENLTYQFVQPDSDFARIELHNIDGKGNSIDRKLVFSSKIPGRNPQSVEIGTLHFGNEVENRKIWIEWNSDHPDNSAKEWLDWCQIQFIIDSKPQLTLRLGSPGAKTRGDNTGIRSLEIDAPIQLEYVLPEGTADYEPVNFRDQDGVFGKNVADISGLSFAGYHDFRVVFDNPRRDDVLSLNPVTDTPIPMRVLVKATSSDAGTPIKSEGGRQDENNANSQNGTRDSRSPTEASPDQLPNHRNRRKN